MWAIRKERGVEMRYQHIMVVVISLAFAAVATFGAIYSEQFPHAASAESVGFDALAHDLLDGVFGAAQPNAGPSK
jgi:hypothetical protein